jgi:PAS domain S-box-containing protein
MSTAPSHGFVRTSGDVAWAVVDAAPDGVLVVDSGGTIVLANGQAATLFGYDDLDGMVGRSVDDLLPDSLRSAHETHRDSYRHHPRRREMGSGLELVARRRDGSEVPVEISLSPLEVDGNLHVIASVRDVSIRRAEQARLGEAQQRLAMIGDRERISRDLHDTVIQRLYGAGLRLQASLGGDEPRLRAAAEHVIGEIDDTISEIRTVIFDLRHDEVVVGGFRGRIESVVDEQRGSSGAQIVLHVVGTLDVQPERSVADAAVAVVRESLSNASRHAAATSVVVDLEVGVDGMLRVVVADDGVGFDEERTPPGNGLRNLAARAHELGGRCGVSSGLGTGTTVTWEVPLGPSHPGADGSGR